jgi:NDP-sugar pyrophosphorylase family protein
MILAAGQGTRLRPLTLTTPKPMVPIGNIPLLERTLRWLAREGVQDVMINLYHLPQTIIDYVGNGRLFGVSVSYSLEENLLGTAGAVKNCEEFFGSEPFFIIYGDNLIDVGLAPLVDRQLQTKSDAVIGLFHTPNPTACGLVQMDEEGKIERFQEKPPLDEVFTDQANAGVYFVTPKIFEYIPAATTFDFGKDVFPAMLAAGENLRGILLKGYIQDTGTPESYRQANEDVLKGKIFGLRGKLIANDPNFTLIGEKAHLAPDVTFRGINIIGPRARVGARTAMNNSIVWEDAKISEDQKLENAIIGAGASVEAGQSVPQGSLVAANVFDGIK